MKVSAYFTALANMKDSGEPGVFLWMQNGTMLWGTARQQGYGAGDTLPDGAAWFSLEGSTAPITFRSGDIVIDVRAVVAIIPQ